MQIVGTGTQPVAVLLVFGKGKVRTPCPCSPCMRHELFVISNSSTISDPVNHHLSHRLGQASLVPTGGRFSQIVQREHAAAVIIQECEADSVFRLKGQEVFESIQREDTRA